MATIKEIADLAGVSRGTVDRVLNKRGAVNEYTAQRILEIASSLDYKPNRAGLALAAQKKKLKLGIILFSAENPFFAEVLDGILQKKEELSGYSCTVLIRQVPVSLPHQLAAIEELIKEEINGLAISPLNDPAIRNKINELTTSGIPVVTFNTDIEHTTRLAYVGSDFVRCGETAAGLMGLLSPTCKLGIITGSHDVLCHTERIAGFKNIIGKSSPNITIIDTVINHDDDDESYHQTLTLLKKQPGINALFFAAGGVHGGCKAVCDLARQQSMRIISFDSVPSTKKLIEEGIIAATICQHPEIQGSKPLEILFNYLTSAELPEKEYLYVDVDIRIRENLF